MFVAEQQAAVEFFWQAAAGALPFQNLQVS
jgi:hypothetical protein